MSCAMTALNNTYSFTLLQLLPIILYNVTLAPLCESVLWAVESHRDYMCRFIKLFNHTFMSLNFTTSLESERYPPNILHSSREVCSLLPSGFIGKFLILR